MNVEPRRTSLSTEPREDPPRDHEAAAAEAWTLGGREGSEMPEYPYASQTEATYENFIAVCPVCEHRNVYNRASDLQTFEPIACKTVVCQRASCAASFNINSDRINPAHQALLFDCHDLLRAKQYMQAVLAITQAYEMLFSHGLRVEVLYRPFVQADSDDLDELNRVAARLYEIVQSFTFEAMRRLFLALAIRSAGFASLAESETWLGLVPTSARNVAKVAAEQIEAVPNADLRLLLVDLASVQIHTLRNRVVHKDGYRPNRQEVEVAFAEAKRIIHRLTSLLKLSGDADWYLNQPGR